MAPTDADLVRRAVAGNVRAFDQLVDRYYPRCLRFAWRLLGERADAEEAAQDAFVRTHGALGACAPERFKPWLMSIVVNCCHTYAARVRRRAARWSRPSAGCRRPYLRSNDLEHLVAAGPSGLPRARHKFGGCAYA